MHGSKQVESIMVGPTASRTGYTNCLSKLVTQNVLRANYLNKLLAQTGYTKRLEQSG